MISGESVTMASLHSNNMHLKAKWVQQFQQDDTNIIYIQFLSKIPKGNFVCYYFVWFCMSSFSTFGLFGFQDSRLLLGVGLSLNFTTAATR